MKAFRCFVLLLCLCLPLFGCAGQKAALPNLATAAYTATLQYAYGGTEFTADYTHTASEKVLTFTAPQSLCGVTARKDSESGEVTLSLGEVCFQAEASDGFFLCTTLLDLPQKRAGEDKYILQNERDFATLLCQNGLPCRVYGEADGKEYDIRISDFTFTAAERSADS